MHSLHVIHRDIKPDNFLMGIDKKKSLVYIIDFGLAKRFRDRKTGQHIPYKDKKSLTGTARYSSIYTHLGIEQGRRDDLESLIYTLIYLNKGVLPWQGLRAKTKNDKYKLIMETKINIKTEELFEGLPKQFITFFEYVQHLQFEDKPDYKMLHNLISEMADESNIKFDILFDWAMKDDKQNSKEVKEKEEAEKNSIEHLNNYSNSYNKNNGNTKENSK